jgi:hypothetical protein
MSEIQPIVIDEKIIRNILLAWSEYWEAKKRKSIWSCLYVDGS